MTSEKSSAPLVITQQADSVQINGHDNTPKELIHFAEVTGIGQNTKLMNLILSSIAIPNLIYFTQAIEVLLTPGLGSCKIFCSKKNTLRLEWKPHGHVVFMTLKQQGAMEFSLYQRISYPKHQKGMFPLAQYPNAEALLERLKSRLQAGKKVLGKNLYAYIDRLAPWHGRRIERIMRAHPGDNFAQVVVTMLLIYEYPKSTGLPYFSMEHTYLDDEIPTRMETALYWIEPKAGYPNIIAEFINGKPKRVRHYMPGGYMGQGYSASTPLQMVNRVARLWAPKDSTPTPKERSYREEIESAYLMEPFADMVVGE